MNTMAVTVFVVLQDYVVVFILLHDWIPLGRLNNLRGVQTADPLAARLRVTLLSALPFALCLVFSIADARKPQYPMWVMIWLWATYGIATLGAVRAWWWPYLGPGDPVRTERYTVRFSNTHAFLPVRNGIVPDTLHMTLHVVLVAILVLLTML